MSYATLIVGRVRYKAIQVTEETETTRYLTELDAREMYEKDVVQPIIDLHNQALAEHEAALKKFDESVKVNEGVEVRRDTGGFRKTTAVVDEVFIGRSRHEVEVGRGLRFVAREREKLNPIPQKGTVVACEAWFKSKAMDHRTWRADIVLSSGTTPVQLPEPLDWFWGFPSASVNKLLEDLELDGWKLVQVSEDHGLYAGTDAPNESFPSRVRYLLHK
jgi:hypothetical protein